MTDTATAAIEQLNSAWAEFKSTNDERIKAEAKGVADILFDTKAAKINDAIDALSAKLKDIEIKAARPAVGADDIAAERKAAFLDFARTGNIAPEYQVKSMQTGVGADGGFAVPKVIDPALQARLVDISPVRSVARVVMAASRDFRILLNRRGTASGWVGEVAARPETATSALQEITPPSGDLYANAAVSGWALNDPIFNLESFVMDEINTEWARAEAAAFITGDGTNKPQGFIKGTPVTTADAARAAGVLQYIASGGAGALPTTIDPYVDMVTSLKAGHRSAAIWMMAKATVGSIRKLKDTTGQYLWQPAVAAGVPQTFLGYNVVEAEDMPALAANAFPVAFGDFGAGYTIVEIGTPVMVRDPYTNKPFTMFYSSKRVGGDLVNSEAIKLLKAAAS